MLALKNMKFPILIDKTLGLLISPNYGIFWYIEA